MNESQVAEALRRLGVPDPDSTAQWAEQSGVPIVAQSVLLATVWSSLRVSEAFLAGLPAGRRLLASEASIDDVLAVATAAAYETAFQLLYAIENDPAGDLDPPIEGAPRIALMETSPEGALTGRRLTCVYESLLSADPTGNDGADFLA